MQFSAYLNPPFTYITNEKCKMSGVSDYFKAIIAENYLNFIWFEDYSNFLLTNEQLFYMTVFVVLSLYAGRARKLNISVNIFSGLYARQRLR